MQRTYRLQKNKQFQYVYRCGKSGSTKELVLLRANGHGVKVGFSVSKKVGKACVRNKVKRRLRACIYPFLGQMKQGQYVVIAKPSCAEASFDQLGKSLRYLLRKQNVLTENVKSE